MARPTSEESAELVLELFDELLRVLALCEKAGGMEKDEAHRVYDHYAKMASQYAVEGLIGTYDKAEYMDVRQMMTDWAGRRTITNKAGNHAAWVLHNQHRLRGWTPETFNESHGARQLSLREFIERVEHIEEEGLPVTLRFTAPSADSEAYSKDTYGEPVLLAIYTDPAVGFTHLVHEGANIAAEDYHMSLCFAPELSRFDLYDPVRGIELGRQAYTHLWRHFDGKKAKLRVRIQNTMAEVLAVEFEDGGDLLRNRHIHALHEAGTYFNRPLHVSM